MASKKELKILCFGDSLTEGYTAGGSSFEPYADTLLPILTCHPSLSKLYTITVDVDGMSGDLVTGSFQGRMKDHYLQALPKKIPNKKKKPDDDLSSKKSKIYDLTIFLGGTNDLGWGRSPTEIYAAIQKTTKIPLESGSKVLLLTIPECKAKIASIDAKRDALNSLILNDKREDVYTLDLFQKIPYHSLTLEEKHELWDDGLHLTAAGYRKMGSLIAGRVVELFGSDAADSSSP